MRKNRFMEIGDERGKKDTKRTRREYENGRWEGGREEKRQSE